MKRIILTSFLAVGLFFAGCSDQSSIVGPSQNTSQQLNKTPIELNLKTLNKKITATKNIDGSVGGTIEIKGLLDGGDITLNGKLNIPAGAFEGTLEISATLDDHTASFDFGPSPTSFNKALSFTMTISGLDLTAINPNDVVFGYTAPNGTFSLISYDNVNVDVNSGTLSVTNAQLLHFSRYNWVK
ncbi:MAG TPA: hypothetical protein ENI76_00595 [Ignavibacteria bacterium]|nr:hypothetical protein [Ignavibacteria bacterium]